MLQGLRLGALPGRFVPVFGRSHPILARPRKSQIVELLGPVLGRKQPLQVDPLARRGVGQHVKEGLHVLSGSLQQHGKPLLAVLRDVVVGAGNVDVLRLMGRRSEDESLVVIAIARHIAIRRRQALEVCHRGRVWPRVYWINLPQLLNTEGDVSRRRSVRLTALALHREAGAARTLNGVCAQILKDTVAHRQAGNFLPRTYGFLRASRSFVVHEKKQAIFLHWPADGGAKDIADQLGRRVAVIRIGERAICQLGQFVEVIVGAGVGVAKVLVDRAVDAVGAAFGHECHLRAAGSSLVGVGIGGGDAKLLYGIERHGQDGGKGLAALVVYANAIETDIALVAARAIHRAAARIVGTCVCSIASIGNAGLQRKQVGHVAPLQRQFLYLILAKRYTHSRVFGVDYRGLPGNFDLGGGRADLKDNVHASRQVDKKLEIGLLVFLETSFFRGQYIGTRGKREKFEFARGRSSSIPA